MAQSEIFIITVPYLLRCLDDSRDLDGDVVSLGGRPGGDVLGVQRGADHPLHGSHHALPEPILCQANALELPPARVLVHL